MNYRSVEQLNRDLARWAERLPRDIDVIVGIPRSGLLAATLLALCMNKPLTDVDGFCEGRLLGGGRRMPDMEEFSSSSVLVVDDSVNTGASLAEVKARLDARRQHHGRTIFGAPYVTPGAERYLDEWFSLLPQPRVFEWNVFHHPNLTWSCVDIDGILCRDPQHHENDDGRRYSAFITDVAPRVVPTVTIGKLVTARLEKYRAQTEDWLGRHHVRYKQLIMMDAPNATVRRQLGNHAEFKAEVYRSDSHWLFIESCERQARQIADAAKLPVYCGDRRLMVYPFVEIATDAKPRLREVARWRGRRVTSMLTATLTPLCRHRAE